MQGNEDQTQNPLESLSNRQWSQRKGSFQKFAKVAIPVRPRSVYLRWVVPMTDAVTCHRSTSTVSQGGSFLSQPAETSPRCDSCLPVINQVGRIYPCAPSALVQTRGQHRASADADSDLDGTAAMILRINEGFGGSGHDSDGEAGKAGCISVRLASRVSAETESNYSDCQQEVIRQCRAKSPRNLRHWGL